MKSVFELPARISVTILSSCFLLSACTSYLDSNTPLIDKWEPIFKEAISKKDIFTFEDVSHASTIMLKMTNYYYNKFNDEIEANLSYIININLPISNDPMQVYLRLNDSNCFEIKKFYISDIAKGFAGTLKGNIVISPSNYKMFESAELSFYLKPTTQNANQKAI